MYLRCFWERSEKISAQTLYYREHQNLISYRPGALGYEICGRAHWEKKKIKHKRNNFIKKDHDSFRKKFHYTVFFCLTIVLNLFTWFYEARSKRSALCDICSYRAQVTEPIRRVRLSTEADRI